MCAAKIHRQGNRGSLMTSIRAKPVKASMASSERTLVIGMGDVHRGDGGVGIAVIRQLCSRLGGGCSFDLLELDTGGIRLMEVMDGYSRAFIVDAMVTGSVPPGTIRSIPLNFPMSASNATSTHDTGLGADLEMGRLLGLQMPQTICVWGIEAKNLNASGSLSEPVRASVPRMVEQLLQDTASEQADSECLSRAADGAIGDEDVPHGRQGPADLPGFP